MDGTKVFRHKDGGKVFLESDLECLDGFEIEEECESLEEAQAFVKEFNTPVIWVYREIVTPHYFLYAGYRGDVQNIRLSGVFGMVRLKKELTFESLEDAEKERERRVIELLKAGESVS